VIDRHRKTSIENKSITENTAHALSLRQAALGRGQRQASADICEANVVSAPFAFAWDTSAPPPLQLPAQANSNKNSQYRKHKILFIHTTHKTKPSAPHHPDGKNTTPQNSQEIQQTHMKITLKHS
jgi:hypothetical protein